MPTCMSHLFGVPCKITLHGLPIFPLHPVAQISHDNKNSHTDLAGCFLRLVCIFVFLMFVFLYSLNQGSA